MPTPSPRRSGVFSSSRLALLAVASLLLAACASTPERTGMQRSPMQDTPYALRVKQTPLELPPVSAPARSARDSGVLLIEATNVLIPSIGGFPPRYGSEAERRKIYTIWSALLTEARAAAIAEGQSERSRYLLAELYRMGHNMEVRDSGMAAQREIHACLERFAESVGCHFSAVRYQLSVAPMQLDAAERSLKALREHFGMEFNEEVERGFIFLSVYRGDNQSALRKIDDYLAIFPDSASRSTMTLLRKAIVENRVDLHIQH